ncbi:MAG TPA: hypothetical protein VN426_06760 [Syntrophomonadaceae bacterium]|nr:hypothetical protein [Syntrophomonadaceae bacterium]
MSKRFLDNNQAQVQYQLSGPCQQCQNHSLEHFIRALRRNDSKEEFLTL